MEKSNPVHGGERGAAPRLSRHSLGAARTGAQAAPTPEAPPSIGAGERIGTLLAAGAAATGAVLRAAVRRARVGRRRPAWGVRVELLVDGMRAFLDALVARDPALLQEAGGRALMPPSPAVRATRRERAQLGGVPAEWIEPALGAGDDDPVVLYLHGGGYVFGSLDSHRDLGCRISLSGSARVALVDYRLAPRHPFPAAVEDALAAYRALLDSGIAARRVVVAGDSAGGGLALALLLEVRNRGWDRPAAAALICPWVDLALTGKSLESNAATDYLDRAMLATWSAHYRNGEDDRHPLVSPLYADLTGLPPLLVHAGAAEILLDDAQAVAARARDAGVAVDLCVFDDMFHDWHLFASWVPEGGRALDEIGRFVRRHAAHSSAGDASRSADASLGATNTSVVG